MMLRGVLRILHVSVFLALLSVPLAARAADEEPSIGQKIDGALAPVAKGLDSFIFTPITLFGEQVPIVLLLLAGTAIFLSLYFKFINLRAFGLALRTVRGKYSTADSPGQITHFQALSTALSATVGLGNIAGVAIAIGLGGPGAVLWMILMGFFGMTSKFTECTLGVKFRRIDSKGRVHGGGMFYLKDGLKQRGLGKVGAVLAVIFAVACIGGALGAGNMFQINQATAQIADTFGVFQNESGEVEGALFGVIVAVLVGLVIIGGIVWIARVTEFLVPIMCIIYVSACAVVLLGHAAEIPAAFVTIIKEAFAPSAAAGGFVGGLIQGIKRGVFSNEAGVGSAGIAHAAVKTDKPASEGVVALLEPFVDTVIVCTMTALVIVVTGMWKVNADVSVDSLSVLERPVAGSVAAASYEKGQLLKIDGLWQQATVTKSGATGWVKQGAVAPVKDQEGVFEAPGSLTLLEMPGDEAAVAELAEGAQVTLDEIVWASVSNPDDKVSGWARFSDLKDRRDWAGGIWLTSQAFRGVISWFPYVLAIAVFLFAFSTMISWSYYGQQALGFLCKENGIAIMAYKVIFCCFVVVGAAASLQNVLVLSDALFFGMVVPNLIGLYVLLPVVKRELASFQAHAAEIDAKDQ